MGQRRANEGESDVPAYGYSLHHAGRRDPNKRRLAVTSCFFNNKEAK